VPRHLKIADGYIELDAPVQFVDLVSPEILAASHPMLEELAGQLSAYQDMIVRVEGHTSNRGKKDELATRSTARAESVAAFLVAQGLPAAKVLSQGYGGTKPKTTNRTKSGRAANERVEFAVVQGGPTP
jgi:outer membrane protein OmpA-like peptidoglycan-associated protein